MKTSKYASRVRHNLYGLRFVSFGPASDCDECAELFGFDDQYDGGTGELIATATDKFNEFLESGLISDEGSFSHSQCGICDSPIGGNRYIWHAIGTDGKRSVNGRMLHFDDGCTTCVFYLTHGVIDNEND